MEPVIPRSSSGFLHQPLDPNGQSIRLLRVLPDLSESGLVQCQMWHDTTSATYTCLSYVWGSEEGQRDILINGDRFRVRRNLWKFLKVARRKYLTAGDKSTHDHVEPKVFWIDALCIDQSSIAERNSQVSFMGSIYSEAEEVIGWLGSDRRLKHALRFWMNFAAEMDFEEQLGFVEAEDYELASFGIGLWHGQLYRRRNGRRDWYTLANCDYWQRAWITQELLLARRFTLLVNDFAMEPARYSALRFVLPSIVMPWADVDATWTTLRLFHGYLKAIVGHTSVTKRDLMSLLCSLPGRGSQIPRDVIYSLRGLAPDGENITVDYESSDEEFIHDVFSTFRPSLCVCNLSHLAVSFDSLMEKGEGRNLLIKLPLRPIPGQPQESKSSICASCVYPGEPREGQQRFCLNDLCTAPIFDDHLLLEVYDSKYYIKFDGYGHSNTIQAGGEEVFGVHLDNEAFEDLSKSASINLPADGHLQAPVCNIYIRACNLLQLFRGHTHDITTTDMICEEALENRGSLADCLYTISNIDADIERFT